MSWRRERNSWEGIFWNEKVSKDSRHPLKFGSRVHSRSQEEKMGEKKTKPTIYFFSLFPLCSSWLGERGNHVKY